MKKILLLIVSGLLIACMAGSAMAAYITIDGDPTASNIVTINPSGGSTSVNLVFSSLDNIESSHIAEVETQCNVEGGTLEARITGLPGDKETDWALTNGLKNVAYIPGAVSFPCVLEVKGTADGYIIIRDIDTQTSQKVQVYVNANIPEFPTVALPVAAILGLVFIFGRKKEGQ